MPSLYIILDKKIPGADIYVNGNSLSKNSDELERMARRLEVRSLMSFFSVSNEELKALTEQYGVDISKGKAASEEKWFAPEEGLRTVNSLLGSLAGSKLGHDDRVKLELLEFVRVLELAKTNDRRWHLGIDY